MIPKTENIEENGKTKDEGKTVESKLKEALTEVFPAKTAISSQKSIPQGGAQQETTGPPDVVSDPMPGMSSGMRANHIIPFFDHYLLNRSNKFTHENGAR